MNRRCFLVLLMLPLLGLQEAGPTFPGGDPTDQVIRFEPVHVFIDSGDVPLAAYQVSIAAQSQRVKIVGLEGSEHEAFAEPPYYDPLAMQQERVILADYSMNSSERLPRGRIRIATIHLQIEGEGDPEFETIPMTFATLEGQEIEASLELERGVNP